MIQLEGFLPDQLAYTMGPLSSVGMFNSILGSYSKEINNMNPKDIKELENESIGNLLDTGINNNVIKLKREFQHSRVQD